MKLSPLSKGLRLVVAVALSGVVTLASSPTSAQTVPDCSTLNLPNPIYGDGGSAAQQYIGKLATVLANLPTPITVLFKASGGCAAVYGLETPTTLSGSIFYWDATGAQKTCNLPAVGGPTQTWGNMVNSHLVCANSPATLPSNIRVEEGPVTAVNFITSTASTETSISSEAAYFVFGFGNNSNVPPGPARRSSSIATRTPRSACTPASPPGCSRTRRRASWSATRAAPSPAWPERRRRPRASPTSAATPPTPRAAP